MSKVYTEKQNLQNIANSIRTKKGTSNTMTPMQMSGEIDSIVTEPTLQSKSETITENTTTTITPDSGYDGLDEVEIITNVGGSGYNAKIMNPNVANDGQIFHYITEIALIDTSNMTHINGMFANCYNLEAVPLLDTGNVIDMSNMFASCSKLTSVPQLNTGNVVTMQNMFTSCGALTTVPIFNTSKVATMANMFSYSNSLSNESLNNILAMCINTTSAYTRPKTLREIGINKNNSTKCQSLSNWNDFVAAGWSTGY